MLNVLTSALMVYFVLGGLTVSWLMWTSRKKFLKSREKASPFECGFDPKDKSRVPFSIRFFLMIMIFLIFDVEMSMLLELPYQLDFSKFKGRIGMILVVWVLLIGTLEEWRRGALNWKS